MKYIICVSTNCECTTEVFGISSRLSLMRSKHSWKNLKQATTLNKFGNIKFLTWYQEKKNLSFRLVDHHQNEILLEANWSYTIRNCNHRKNKK